MSYSVAATPRSGPSLTALAYMAIAALGLFLLWASATMPASLPPIAPWEFSPPEYLLTALVLLWYVRGLALTPIAERPPVWRQALFLLGLALVYGVLQTRFEYWAQHMFFVNRTQHVVMHHLGPFLMALGLMGGTLRRGMPDFLRRIVESRPVLALIHMLQQPVIAVILFSGTFVLWLIPAVHFRAMIDLNLYALMNWTMVLDGVLFWAVVLDPRPKPPARAGYGTRLAMAIAVMFPQIAVGAIIGFSSHDLYPYYALCGRIFADMSAINDQHVGGIIMWIPPAMMSALAVVLVLNALRIHEDRSQELNADASSVSTLASSWTGR